MLTDHACSRLNPAVRELLTRLGEEDQEGLRLGLLGQTGKRVDGDLERIQLLKQVIAEVGWPGISIAGFDGARGAWLIAQHADRDHAFQRECLDLVSRAFAEGEVTGLQFAYLTDRVLSAEGRPQQFGTQGAPVYSTDEREEVERRRAMVGLPTIDEMSRLRAEYYDQEYTGCGFRKL